MRRKKEKTVHFANLMDLGHLKGTYMVTHQPAFCGKELLKKCCLTRDERKDTHGNVVTCKTSSDYSDRFLWMI